MNRVFVRSVCVCGVPRPALGNNRNLSWMGSGAGLAGVFGAVLVSDLVLSVALLCITYIPLGCLAPQQWSFAPMS